VHPPSGEWHAVNLTIITANIRRKVQTESATGSVDSRRVKTNLTLSVQKMHFSAAVSSTNPNATAAQQGATLSISGQVTQENPFVKMGAFHTLDIEADRDVRITKVEWDSIAFGRVREASDEARGAEEPPLYAS